MSDQIVQLVSDRQSVRSSINAALAPAGIRIQAQGWDDFGNGTSDAVADILILDALGRDMAAIEAAVPRAKNVVVMGGGWSMAERAALRRQGRIDLVPAEFDRRELELRLQAFALRGDRQAILIIEDDPDIAAQLSTILDRNGFAVQHSADLVAARAAIAARRFDLLLVDRNLPGGADGLDFIKALREQQVFVPALILSARGETRDVAQGLRAGANDYVRKPFDIEELLARIEVLLQPAQDDEVLRYGALELHGQASRVRWAGQWLELTDKEFALLRYLAQRPGLDVPPSMLLIDVWNDRDGDRDSNVVASTVKRLRQRLEHVGAPPAAIVTKGKCYRFDPEAILSDLVL